ncbi:MAG TPA: M50 family metallopeptidase [Candidatus Saccharimonadaceae bacterium]|nr:M50 family metallopeptidase [Candidatus Saccharimonadaceae bacterium]
MLVIGIIVGIIILVLLVVAHELGHALVAHRNGVKVEEFGIGFPPKAWGKVVKHSFLGENVLYSVNWLPIGGFVRMQGEHDADASEGDYGRASFWQKTKIMLAGVGVNWLVAAVLLTILAWTGLPQVLPNQFTVPADTHAEKKPVQLALVEAGSPAAKAGLKTGDEVTKINAEAITSPTQLSAVTKDLQGQTVHIFYTRGGVAHETKATLRSGNAAGQGYLGVGPTQEFLTRATWSAPIVGIVTTAQFSWATLEGVGTTLGDFVSGLAMHFSTSRSVQKQANANIAAAKSNLAGPVSIVGVIFPAAEKAGPTQLVLLTAIISLTLAVMNVLPIPALDGGRWYTMAIFKAVRRKLTEVVEERIQATGFAIIIVLVILVTIGDIGRVF